MRFLESAVAQVRDLSGDLILDLSHEAGYRHASLAGTGGALWDVPTETSAYVDGETQGPTPPRRITLRRVERILVSGNRSLTGDAYWRSVEDKLDLIEAAVSQTFLWTVGLGGYVWTYRTVGPANLDASEFSPDAYATGERVVILSFTVQPNPTKAVP